MAVHSTDLGQPPKKQKFYQILYVQVIFAIIAGSLISVRALNHLAMHSLKS